MVRHILHILLWVAVDFGLWLRAIYSNLGTFQYTYGKQNL